MFLSVIKKIFDKQIVLIKDNLVPYNLVLKTLLMLLCLFTYSNSYGQSQDQSLQKASTSTQSTSIIKIALPPYQTAEYEEQKSFNKLIEVSKNFWSLWGHSNQRIVEFISLPISENAEALRQKTIDIAALNYLDEEPSDIIYSIPFATYQQRLFRRINKNKKHASIGIYDKNHKLLSHLHSSIEREYYDNMDTLLANYHRFDLLYTMEPWLLEEKLKTLKLTKKFYSNQAKGIKIYLRAATRINDKNTLSIINESFRNIDKIKAQQWQEELIKTAKTKAPISLMIGGYLTTLNAQEKEFVLNNNEISTPMSVDGFPPFIISPDSMDIQTHGLVIDIYNKITQKTGMIFKPYYTADLMQALNSVRGNETTLFSLLEYTEKRNKIFDFSIPYINNEFSIIYRKTQNPIPNITDLNTEVIAIMRNFNSSKILRNLFPNATFKYYSEVENALTAVSYGDADIFIINSLVGNYFIKSKGIFNLTSKKAPHFNQDSKIHFTALKGNKGLISIVDRALKTISTEEFSTLLNHWQHKNIVIKNNDENIKDLYRYGLYFIIILILLSSLFYFLYLRQSKIKDKARLELVETLKVAEAARIEAEQSSHAKISFLARMSHEIRTPMNGILGMAETISFTNLDKNQHDLLNTLKGSATDLLALLNDVLDYSKMDAGELNLESIPVDICALSRRIVKNFEHNQKAEKLKLALHIDDKINSSYFSDPTRLIQVLNNLFSNAVKFTEKGVIELSVMLIDSNTSENETVDTIRFAVRDTGIGIPSNKHASLFTPFIQADSDTTRKFGGTGLGLSICQEIVASMGGEIALSSSRNLGSLFYFSLKLKQSKPIEASKERRKNQRAVADENDDRFKELRVLIVEDNIVNIKVLNAQLERLHVNADIAENGQEALVMHNTLPYDIVFSDCHMPVMDGFELAKQINQSQTSRPIWLIAVTADALSGSAEKCISVGFDDYMSKPSSQELVANKLNNAYRQILHKQDLANDSSSETQQYKIFEPKTLLSINSQDPNVAKKTFSLFTDNWQAEKIQILSALDQQNNHDLLLYLEQLRSSLNYLCGDKLDDYIQCVTQHAQANNLLEINITVHNLIQQLDILTNEIHHWLKNN